MEFFQLIHIRLDVDEISKEDLKYDWEFVTSILEHVRHSTPSTDAIGE